MEERNWEWEIRVYRETFGIGGMGTGKHCGGLKAGTGGGIGTGTCYRAEDQGRDVWGKWWRSFMENPSRFVWEKLWGRIPSDKPVKGLGKIMVCGPSPQKFGPRGPPAGWRNYHGTKDGLDIGPGKDGWTGWHRVRDWVRDWDRSGYWVMGLGIGREKEVEFGTDRGGLGFVYRDGIGWELGWKLDGWMGWKGY